MTAQELAAAFISEVRELAELIEKPPWSKRIKRMRKELKKHLGWLEEEGKFQGPVDYEMLEFVRGELDSAMYEMLVWIVQTTQHGDQAFNVLEEFWTSEDAG